MSDFGDTVVSLPLASELTSFRTLPQSLMRPMKENCPYIVNLGIKDTENGEKMLKSVVHDKRHLDILRSYAFMIKYHIDSVIEYERAAVDAMNSRQFAAFIEPAWHNLLADFMHNYNPCTTARNCSGFCLKRGTTMCVSGSHNVYGCWLHGYLHVCAVDAECYVTQTNRDLSRTCVLSGRPLGYVMGSGMTFRQAQGSKKQQYDYFKLLNELQESRDTAKNEADTEEARISRYVGVEHRTNEASHADRVVSDARRVEDEKDGIYKTLITSSGGEDALNESSSSAIKAPEVQFARIVDMKEEDQERKRAALLYSMRRTALLNSSSAVTGLVEQAMRVAKRVTRTVVNEVFCDLHRRENRLLYNKYQKGRAIQGARDCVNQLVARARRQNTFVSYPDVLLMLETYNREYVELKVQIHHEPTYVDTIIDNILWLWDACNKSPHVRRSLIKNEHGATVLPMESENSCSLRQFTLACLYHMRDGLTVSVPYSIIKETVPVLAPHRALHIELPPENHVGFFGAEAMRELQRRIRIREFGGEFDVHGFVTIDARDSQRAKTFSAESGGGGGGVRAAKKRRVTGPAVSSSVISRAIKGSVEERRVRKSKARSTYEEVVQLERTKSYSTGTVRVTSNVDNTSVSLTELQCTPFHMREPMLTGGSRYTRRNVYNSEDVQVGRRFISVTLNSYEHLITDLK